MTKANLTHITLIVDRSGSMWDIKDDMEAAINKFLTDQKVVPGDCTVSAYQFDDRYSVLYENVDIEHVNKYTLEPRNMTALYDAIGKSINRMGEHFNSLPESERPEKVITVIVTDGGENASREFSREQVFEMIKHQQDKYGWAFTFVGANQDAYGTGASLGISKGASMNYGANYKGTQAVSSTLSAAVTRTRMAGGPASASYLYTQEEQDAADQTVGES